MSDEFEIKHFDNRVQPGSDISPPKISVPNDDDQLALGTRSPDIYDYNPPQQSESARMAQYQARSPTGDTPVEETPPQSAHYRSPVRASHDNSQNREPGYGGQNQGQHSAQIDNSDGQTVENDEGDLGACGCCLYALVILLVICTLPFSLFVCVKVVQEYERAVMFRLGRVLPEVQGPGMFLVFPCIEDFIIVDLRTLSFDVPPQEILTKDSVTVAVDAVVYYKISDPKISVVKVANAYNSTLLLAQTSLRNVLGTKELREVLAQRDQIVASMQEMLDEGTDPWGVKVERVEIKDVKLPTMLQRAMAKEAESQREAQAKVIAAEGEMMASKSLREAAQIISENPSALQLRYLQTLGSIASERPSTILFPLPINSLGGMKKMN